MKNVKKLELPKELAQKNLALSRRAAAEGMLLLKNDGALPLAKGASVALFGEGQIRFSKGGQGSGDVKSAYVRTPLEGLRIKEQEGKVMLNASLATAYEADPGLTVTPAMAKKAAQCSETAIVVLTRTSGEGWDRSANPGGYYFTREEKEMLAAVTAAGFSHVAVVLNIPAVTDVSPLLGEEIGAILLAWQPGMEGGLAIADVLCGDADPCGKLPDTFPMDYNDLPTAQHFNAKLYSTEYTEDIFLGYRYFETFDPTYQKVAFPFGFGLSYTTFALENVTVETGPDVIQVNLQVTNTGSRAGKEVVQVYYSAPQGRLGKAGLELAAYEKTQLLQPGETQTFSIPFATDSMASYDDTGLVQASAWLLEAGEYTIYVGNSIRDAKANGCRGVYDLAVNTVTEQVSRRCPPTLLRQRLTVDGSLEPLEPDTSLWIPLAAKGQTLLDSKALFRKHHHAKLEISPDCTKWGLRAHPSGEGNRWITFLVDAPAAGVYQLALGIGNGGEALKNALRVYVNEEEIGAVNLEFPATGDDWNILRTETVAVPLPAGPSALRLELAAGNRFRGILSYATLEYGQPVGPDVAPQPGAGRGETPVVDQGLTYADLQADETRIPDFLKQLTDLELAEMGVGHPAHVPVGTGTIGGPAKYGVPLAETADGPAGLRLGTYTTAWPSGTCQAATFNPDLVTEIGAAVGAEANALGIHVWLAPGMDMHRDPLNGRNFEYYSEDPLLTGEMAAALTRGVQSQGVGVTVKHFICNERETQRGMNDSRVSERALRELYLKPFEIAVKQAQPWCLMTSYNILNGRRPTETRDLIQGILREEWGFEGLVMTDWWNSATHFLEVAAGHDVRMPNGDEEQVAAALRAGLITREQLEENATHVLQLLLKTKAQVYQEEIPEPVVVTGPVTRIDAIDCVARHKDVSLESCEDDCGGVDFGNNGMGKWYDYQLIVQEPGLYQVTWRFASWEGRGAVQLLANSQPIGILRVNQNTGSWQKWATSAPIAVELPAGEITLHAESIEDGYNIRWIELRKQ